MNRASIAYLQQIHYNVPCDLSSLSLSSQLPSYGQILWQCVHCTLLGNYPSAHFCKPIVKRMHSSRMHTIHNSGCILEVGSAPGGCLLRWCLLQGGTVCSRGCLLQGGVCSWGVSAPGGCLLQGRGCLLWGGGVCSRGVSAPGEGVSALGGVCLGVSAPGGCLLLGVSAPGSVCSRGGGVCSWGVSALGGVCSWGGMVSQHALRQTPPPPLWTDRCL